MEKALFLKMRDRAFYFFRKRRTETGLNFKLIMGIGGSAMKKRHGYKKWFGFLIAMMMAAHLVVPGTFGQTKKVNEADYHNQQGVEYFKKGFYDHTPRQQAEEAERNYGLAVKEFKAAIAKDPSFLEAHRNLARVYNVQRNFEGAAEEYQRVTELAPGDLDAYVNLALACIELKRFDEAIQALERAKTQTSDQKILKTLDGYIAKVRSQASKEVR
jgi:tetratricopeptide (TPR) repeat protein